MDFARAFFRSHWLDLTSVVEPRAWSASDGRPLSTLQVELWYDRFLADAVARTDAPSLGKMKRARRAVIADSVRFFHEDPPFFSVGNVKPKSKAEGIAARHLHGKLGLSVLYDTLGFFPDRPRLCPDFNLVASHNLLIEIDGDYHFQEDAEMAERDRYKDVYCHEHGIHLARIPCLTDRDRARLPERIDEAISIATGDKALLTVIGTTYYDNPRPNLCRPKEV